MHGMITVHQPRTYQRWHAYERVCQYDIAIKCGFHSHPYDSMDLRPEHFKQKLTPMEQLMMRVVAVALRFRWVNLFN